MHAPNENQMNKSVKCRISGHKMVRIYGEYNLHRLNARAYENTDRRYRIEDWIELATKIKRQFFFYFYHSSLHWIAALEGKSYNVCTFLRICDTISFWFVLLCTAPKWDNQFSMDMTKMKHTDTHTHRLRIGSFRFKSRIAALQHTQALQRKWKENCSLFLCVREKKHKINNMKKENASKTQRTFDLYTLVWSVICCDAAAGYGLCHTAHGIVYILLSQRNSLPCKLSEENQSNEWIWGKTSFDGNLLVSLTPFFLRFLQL